MFKRLGVGKYTHWVIAALFFALWSILLWNLATQKARYRVDSEYQASAAAQQTQESIAETCAGEDTTAAIIECVARETTAGRDAQRGEYDLAAQQEMADWALGAVLVNSLALFAALIGILYVRDTLNENRKVTRAAIGATKAAALSASVAQQQLRVSQRPYVGYVATSTHRWMAKNEADGTLVLEQSFLEIDVIFKNSGQVPTKRAAVWISDVMFIPATETPDINIIEPESLDVMSNQSTIGPDMEIFTDKRRVDYIKTHSILSGSLRAFVFAGVIYKGFYDDSDEMRTRACIEIKVVGDPFLSPDDRFNSCLRMAIHGKVSYMT